MAVGKIISDNKRGHIGLIIYDLFIILVSALIIYYINILEQSNCACSESNKRNFIKYYSITLIAYILTTIIYPQFKNDIVQLIVVIFSIINMITLYTYIRSLRSCHCSISTNENIYIYEFITFYSRHLILFGIYTILVFIAIYITSLKLPKYININ